MYAQACRERKYKPDPPKILEPDLIKYIEAFRRLSTCRQVGMSYGPIPWTALNDYCKRYEIDDEDFLLFSNYITALDIKFLEKSRKK